MRARASVFEGIGGGANIGFSVPNSGRYKSFGWTELLPKGLANSISSAVIDKEGLSEASLFLFDGNSTVPNWDYRRLIPWMKLRFGQPQTIMPGLDFHGDFLCLTKPENASDRFYVSDLRSRDFDNRTMSVMLVSQWHEKEERLSVRKIFTFPWNLAWDNALKPVILNAIPGANIARINDPLFTWLAFPWRSGFSESKVYLVASQWVVIHASGIGMNAWMIFFIELHVQNKNLKIDIVDFDYHVWPGTGQGQLMAALQQQKGTIMSGAQIFGGALLSLLPSQCDDIYLLPGDQTGSRPTTPEIRTGDALNDVTIVLEKPTTSPPSIFRVFSGGTSPAE